MSTVVYVGIDQSYSGFAIVFYSPRHGDYTSWVREFPAAKYGKGVDRLNTIGQWLDDQFTMAEGDLRQTIGHVCMEGYSMGAKQGREQSGELGATVKSILWTWSIYPTIVAPTSLKKFVTGKGNSAKNEMLLAVYKKWGAEFHNDNEADAYGLARMAEYLDAGVPPGAPKYERDTIAALTPETERFPPLT